MIYYAKFQKIYILLIIFSLLSSLSLAYHSSSTNYNLQISELGISIGKLTSENYSSLETIQDKSVGQNTSVNYNGCLGWYCFFPQPKVTEEAEEEREGNIGVIGYTFEGIEIPYYTNVLQSLFSKDLPLIVQQRNRAFIILLLIAILLYIIAKKRKKKELQHEKKYYYDNDL